MRARNRRQAWRASVALPWLIACVYAQAWADPMRPLIPPANSASASAPAVAPSGSPPDRSARPREGDAPREAERLIAIRQDSGPGSGPGSGPDSTKRWQALLGDRWLKVGDRYDNYTVGAIDANSVQLADGRQRRTLHLLPPLWRPGPNKDAVSRSSDAPGGSTDLAQAGPAVLSPHRATGLSSP